MTGWSAQLGHVDFLFNVSFFLLCNEFSKKTFESSFKKQENM